MVETLKANVELEKTRILAFVNRTGPVVSNTIAKSLNLNSFLTAAILSELVNEKRLNASFIRVGGSPLYYLNGQDEQLMKFTNFLGHKEKETYELLKKEGVLLDKQLHPAVRVAIKDVKDFAVPLKVAKGSEEVLFWKFKFFNEADSKIKEILKEEEKKIVVEKKADEVKEKELAKEARKARRKTQKSVSAEKVLEKWASENKVLVSEIIQAKGKDAKAKVTIKSEIGDIDFLLVLKNKKSISESDLAIAYQDGMNSKLPVIFLSPGKLNKQSQAYFEGLGKNLILRKL